MPSSAIVDVAIGIAFVYLFLSLICSVVNETIAAIFALRQKNLVAGINSLFSESKLHTGTTFVEAVYANGLIRGFYKDPPGPESTKSTPQVAADPPGEHAAPSSGGASQVVPSVLETAKKLFNVNLPSYIPARAFSSALLDVLVPPANGKPRVLEEVRLAIVNLPNSTTKNALLSLVSSSEKEVADFQDKVEKWFDDSMERAASWYKRKAQRILLCIGLFIAVLLNVDTIKLAQTLWNNPVARQATVDLAQKYVDENKSQLQTNQQLSTQAQNLFKLGQELPFPFGWHTKPPLEVMFWLEALTGWFITALGLSLGAPFWFDTLNKFMSVRAAVKPAATEQKSDRSKAAGD